MSIAYVILAHRSPDQLHRLVRRLYHPEDRVFVHIDRSTAVAPFEQALAPFLAERQTQMARRRFRSRWANYGLVAATLATLEQALQESSFTHVTLLSGEDYPLVPPAVLRSFFESARGRSFMFYSAGDGTTPPPDRYGNERWYWSGDLRRLTHRHYHVLGRTVHLPNRYLPDFPRHRPPRDLALFQGSQWWTLSRSAAQFVVEAFIRRPELRRYFRRTQAPDEFAFQMVLCNSPLLPTIVNDDLHFVDWQDWHARTLGLADLPAISQTPKLFARKVSLEQSPQLLDEIDRLCDKRAEHAARTLEVLRQTYLSDPAPPDLQRGRFVQEDHLTPIPRR